MQQTPATGTFQHPRLLPGEASIALPLVEPDASHVLGLAAPDGEQESPLTRELFAVAQQLDLSAEIEKHIMSWRLGKTGSTTAG